MFVQAYLSIVVTRAEAVPQAAVAPVCADEAPIEASASKMAKACGRSHPSSTVHIGGVGMAVCSVSRSRVATLSHAAASLVPAWHDGFVLWVAA